MHICDAATLDEALVCCFENCFAERGIANDSKAPDHEERSDSSRLVTGRILPDVDGSLDQSLEYFLEGKQVWEEWRERRQGKF